MKVKCPNCDKEYVPDLAKRLDFETRYIQWKVENERIQNVWPHALNIQREQLQTGICSDKCWNQFLGVCTS